MYDINERVINVAKILIEGSKTVREVAKLVGISKSTVHHDISVKLKELNYELYKQARTILDYNKKIRHIRGGEATRLKYLKEPL